MLKIILTLVDTISNFFNVIDMINLNLRVLIYILLPLPNLTSFRRQMCYPSNTFQCVSTYPHVALYDFAMHVKYVFFKARAKYHYLILMYVKCGKKGMGIFHLSWNIFSLIENDNALNLMILVWYTFRTQELLKMVRNYFLATFRIFFSSENVQDLDQLFEGFK